MPLPTPLPVTLQGYDVSLIANRQCRLELVNGHVLEGVIQGFNAGEGKDSAGGTHNLPFVTFITNREGGLTGPLHDAGERTDWITTQSIALFRWL